jgi:uncharacterized phage-associated protein
MVTYLENKEKTLNAILLIVDQLGGKCDFHKLFKILYFADQKHLVEYGRPITEDRYIAMRHGPVPSEVYDLLKYIRSGSENDVLDVPEKGVVVIKHQPDMDELSSSEERCLLASIAENKDLSFSALTDKSHKQAWEKAQEQTDEMDFVDIAQEGGATEEMLNYIRLNLENKDLFKQYAVVS